MDLKIKIHQTDGLKKLNLQIEPSHISIKIHQDKKTRLTYNTLFINYINQLFDYLTITKKLKNEFIF
jgi:hypothetical protein